MTDNSKKGKTQIRLTKRQLRRRTIVHPQEVQEEPDQNPEGHTISQVEVEHTIEGQEPVEVHENALEEVEESGECERLSVSAEIFNDVSIDVYEETLRELTPMEIDLKEKVISEVATGKRLTESENCEIESTLPVEHIEDATRKGIERWGIEFGLRRQERK